MFCGKCGTLIKDGDSFCTQCGTRKKDENKISIASDIDFKRIVHLTESNRRNDAVTHYFDVVKEFSCIARVVGSLSSIQEYLEKQRTKLTKKREIMDQNEPDSFSDKHDEWDDQYNDLENKIDTINDLCESIETGKDALVDFSDDLPSLIFNLDALSLDDKGIEALVMQFKRVCVFES